MFTLQEQYMAQKVQQVPCDESVDACPVQQKCDPSRVYTNLRSLNTAVSTGSTTIWLAVVAQATRSVLQGPAIFVLEEKPIHLQ